MNSTAYPSDNYLEALSEGDSKEQGPQPSHAAPEFGTITSDGQPPVDDFRNSAQDPQMLELLQQQAEASSLTTWQSLENGRRVRGETQREDAGYSWQLQPEAATAAIDRHSSVQGELSQQREQLSAPEQQFYAVIASRGSVVTSWRYAELDGNLLADGPQRVFQADTKTADPNLN